MTHLVASVSLLLVLADAVIASFVVALRPGKRLGF